MGRGEEEEDVSTAAVVVVVLLLVAAPAAAAAGDFGGEGPRVAHHAVQGHRPDAPRSKIGGERALVSACGGTFVEDGIPKDKISLTLGWGNAAARTWWASDPRIARTTACFMLGTFE